MEISKLDIVIPCYNPTKGWVKNIQLKVDELSKLMGFTPNVIVVNDGSTSNGNIKELINSHVNFSVYHLPFNQGKGSALRVGVRKSTAEYILFTDVDFPYTIDSVMSVWKALEEQGYNVVLGRRDGTYYQKVPFFRKKLSKAFRACMKMFLRLKTDDTQCGLKAFDTKGKNLFLKTEINRFLFDLEFVHYCSIAKKVQLASVPVQLNSGVVFSKMPIKVLANESINFFKIILKALFK